MLFNLFGISDDAHNREQLIYLLFKKGDCTGIPWDYISHVKLEQFKQLG